MAASVEILTAIRELTNSKQIDRTELHGLLEDGINAALAKKHGPTVQAEVSIDENKGAIKIVLLKTVVDEVTDAASQISLEEARFEDAEFQVGDQMEIPVDFAEFGRTAVQAAKQRIIQRVREGERTKIRDEFSSRVGDLLSGEVQQIERGKLVIMLNKFREAEAIIPYREQNHREHFHQGDPIRAVLKRVEETPKGPRLVLSRADSLFVKALFKLEVPEIQQNLVEIRASAREVGSRTKIAVFSRDDSVDPVGACVGLKGSRVQAVVNELGGERIARLSTSPPMCGNRNAVLTAATRSSTYNKLHDPSPAEPRSPTRRAMSHRATRSLHSAQLLHDARSRRAARGRAGRPRLRERKTGSSRGRRPARRLTPIRLCGRSRRARSAVHIGSR